MNSDYIGKKFKTNNSGWCTIIKYINNKNVVVVFDDDGSEIKCELKQLKNGCVKNKNNIKVFGVGYNDLKVKFNISGHSKEYLLWKSMLCRCYSSKYHEIQPSYKDVVCDSYWHIASNFINDVSKLPNYDKIFNDCWQLDKDILGDGKVYNKDSVCFVPQSINKLLTLRGSDRGAYKLGVSYITDIEKYCASISINSKRVFLGFFENEYDAFTKYKAAKEQAIKDKANEYSHVLSKDVYNALINYTIE